MTKTVALAASLCVASLPALAQDRTITLSPTDIAAWANVGAVYERCVGTLALRRDASVCQNLGVFLDQFAARVQAAPPVAAPPPPPPPPPASSDK